jgi:hypothetical protein
VSSTLDADTDVERCVLVLADDENGLVDFETEDLGLDEVYGGAVDTDEATALPGVCDGGCGLDKNEMANIFFKRRGLAFFLPKVWTAFTDEAILRRKPEMCVREESIQ